MITNREMNLDDYLAMSRRRMKVILVPTLLVTVAGFLISFAFSPSSPQSLSCWWKDKPFRADTSGPSLPRPCVIA